VAAPAFICEMKAWLAAASPTGERSAAWKSAWGAMLPRNTGPILSLALENSSDRKIAVPRVPPICRVKVADEVATPMSRGGTAFWIARVSGWKLKPRPIPKNTMMIIDCHSGCRR
jgi:hypothetical protein